MQIHQIDIKDLVVSPENARSKKSVNGVETLAASIDALGLLCPLIGVEGKKGTTEIIAGQRRLAAMNKLQKANPSALPYQVPVYIIEGITAAQAIEMSLHENIERELLGTVDEAEAFARMKKEGLAVKEIASNFGRTERFVNQRLKMSELPTWAKRGITSGEISLSVAQVMTSATKAQLKELASGFKSNAAQFIFQSPDGMARVMTESSRIKVGVALFDVEASGLDVIRNLFDEEFDGIIPDVDTFWLHQLEAMDAKKAEFEALGHTVQVFGREEYFASHKYEQSKAKKHLIVIEANYDGSVDITENLKLKPGIEAPAAAGVEDDAADDEPETKGDLTKKSMVELNEVRSMSVAYALAIGTGRGYITQCANVQMMFGSHFSSNGGQGQPHNWNEDLAAEHKYFNELEESAASICKILNISVPEGEWAINVISHPRLSGNDYGGIIYDVMTMETEVALKLQGLLVASHALLVADDWESEESYNIVEMVGGFLEADEENGFSANADWELTDRFVTGIRNRDTLSKLLTLCAEGGASLPHWGPKTKISDLKKLLVNYMTSNNGRKAPWLSWLDFPAKELD
jgi:ParB family transcriptional regulator, chromosome partitioning protein